MTTQFKENMTTSSKANITTLSKENIFNLDLLLNSNKDGLTLKVSDSKCNVYKTIIGINHPFVSAFLSGSVEKLLELFNIYGYRIDEYDDHVMILTNPPLDVKFKLPLINNFGTNPESETIRLLIKKVESLTNKLSVLECFANIVIIPEYPLVLDINTKELFFNFNTSYSNRLEYLYPNLSFQRSGLFKLSYNNNSNPVYTAGFPSLYFYDPNVYVDDLILKSIQTVYTRTDFLNIERLVNLERLVIFQNDVSDLRFLTNLPKLKYLMLVGLPNLTDLEFINSLINLEELYIGYCDKLLDLPIKKSVLTKLNILGISKSKTPDIKLNNGTKII
jgi:hypothetical protein